MTAAPPRSAAPTGQERQSRRVGSTWRACSSQAPPCCWSWCRSCSAARPAGRPGPSAASRRACWLGPGSCWSSGGGRGGGGARRLAAAGRGGTQSGSVPFTLAAAGLGLGLSVGPLLTQALAHVPPTRAADASGLLTTTVQLGQLMGVTVLGSVYLTRAAAVTSSAVTASTVTAGTVTAGVAMSGTATWLAVLSVA